MIIMWWKFTSEWQILYEFIGSVLLEDENQSQIFIVQYSCWIFPSIIDSSSSLWADCRYFVHIDYFLWSHIETVRINVTNIVADVFLPFCHNKLSAQTLIILYFLHCDHQSSADEFHLRPKTRLIWINMAGFLNMIYL